MQFHRIPKPAFRSFVQLVSRTLAYRSYRRRFPDQPAERAEDFARRNWPKYTDMALDFLALREAAQEAEAAPWN